MMNTILYAMHFYSSPSPSPSHSPGPGVLYVHISCAMGAMGKNSPRSLGWANEEDWEWGTVRNAHTFGGHQQYYQFDMPLHYHRMGVHFRVI